MKLKILIVLVIYFHYKSGTEDKGVLARNGHTEAAVDLAKLTGAKPAGVICEIMNDDGTMAKDKILKF